MSKNDNFKYLHIGLPDDVLRRKLYGDFEGAAAAIDRHLACPSTPEPLKKCLTAQREMILRLPEDYPYSRDEALELVRKEIPDFSEEEFQQLEDQWQIDWIYDHGQPRYFNRFFETLCKTHSDIAQRAGIQPVGSDGQDGGSGRLKTVMERMKAEGSLSSRTRCRATLRMKDELFVPGQRIRACLPIPCGCSAQSDIVLEQVSPAPTHISPEDAPQRVVFWEVEPQENPTFTVEFSYTQKAVYHDLSHPLPAEERPTFDTEEQPPHILFTPYLRTLAEELTNGVDEPVEKARRIYDFITKSIKYTFMRPYFGLENIAESCARNKVGDCGVMTLLFITLCRCVGVPARWESGWKAEPGFCGAHDWARFYAASYGWLYADPSFGCGAVRDGDEARRQHYFGNLDPFRMVANTQFQGEFDVPWEHWRADPYDNQVGEMELPDRGLRYEEFERTKEVLDFTLL